MKAVAYKVPGPIDRPDALLDITLETPEAAGRDLLVKVIAVSVNPVDTKLRLGAPGFVFSTTQTDQHFADIVELIAPQGRFGLIDDPEELNAMPLKLKAVSLQRPSSHLASRRATPRAWLRPPLPSPHLRQYGCPCS